MKTSQAAGFWAIGGVVMASLSGGLSETELSSAVIFGILSIGCFLIMAALIVVTEVKGE